jgi:WD40 repeat protein
LNIIILDQENKYNIITELKGHNSPVTFIKYFLNENNLEQYLLSSDISQIVIIWDINNIFNPKLKNIIKTGYNEYIFSCLILFNINKDNIIITSTVDSSQTDNSYSRIYSLNNCKLIKNILGTNGNISLYLLFWFNRKNSQNHLIECCQGKICVYNLEKNEIYCELKSDNDCESYCCGVIYKKGNEDYLITTSDGDYIRIWNLYNKKIFSFIKTEYCGISYIIRWSSNYYIVADQENYSFKVIDIQQLKVITDNKVNIKNKEKGVICIKKIYHPKYGESILTCDGDNEIKLWIVK